MSKQQNKYEPVIGLEIHIELSTKTKMFCGCLAQYFGHGPNSHVCPVCLGLPGALPVPNRQALTSVLLLGKALHCRAQDFSKFDRKNYFYPDLAKGYQISQYDLPFSRDGWVEVEVDGVRKKIGITRAHMEEDTAKLTHTIIDGQKVSLIDFNRSGVPLIEVVSEPDITSAQEAKAYAAKLQQIVQYLGISQARIQEGEMRIEPNVSLRRVEERKSRRAYSSSSGQALPSSGQARELPNYKVEVKNIGSLSAVEKAIEYEIMRQTEELEKERTLRQETRGWDETKGETFVQRIKEDAQDYRYFPEPDIPPFTNTLAMYDTLRVPELPDEKQERFCKQYGLSLPDSMSLTAQRELADWFEEAVRAYGKDPKKITSWMLGEFLRYLNEKQIRISEVTMLPAQLAQLQHLVDEAVISLAQAKVLFPDLFLSGKDPQELVKEKNIGQVSDAGQLAQVVDEVLVAYAAAVADYRSGKKEVISFLLGQVMAKTGGRANPQIVRELLEGKLSV